MPLYEYVCGKCGYEFERLCRFSQAGEGAVCPSCGQPDARKRLSAFAAVSKTGNGSTKGVAGSSSCASCSAASCDGCKR